MNSLQEFLSCEVFFASHFWDIFIFVTATSLSSCMPISSLLLSSSGCISRVSWMAVVLHSTVSYSVMPITVYWSFTSSIITSRFFAPSSLLPRFLFWLSTVKCHSGLWLGDRRHHTYALLSVCESNNSCAVSGHQQSLKRVMWLVTDGGARLLFM